MELWRARPGDVIVLPVFPGEVTVTDMGLGVRYLTTRVEGQKAGALDLGDLTEVRLLASLDGVNAVWLERQEPPRPPALESRLLASAAKPGADRRREGAKS